MKKTISLNIFLITTLIVLGTACKKDNTRYGAGGAAETANTGLSYTLSSTGDPSGTYSGIFFEGTFNSSSLNVSTYFYNSSVSWHPSFNTLNSAPTATVSSVYFNNTKLYLDIDKDYFDTVSHLSLPPAWWTVNGTSDIPGFTFNCGTALPSYNTSANLPDTVNSAQDLVIPISGSWGYDQIVVSVGEAINGVSMGYNLFASPKATSVTFSKDSLSKLVPDNNASIIVNLYKFNPQSISGKNFLFVTYTTYHKFAVKLK